jgi:hypothetical protein
MQLVDLFQYFLLLQGQPVELLLLLGLLEPVLDQLVLQVPEVLLAQESNY